MRRLMAELVCGEDGYLDAGTGSIVIQAVIGCVVGGLVAIKLFWNRITAFLGKIASRGRSQRNQ